jgi:hypothetical protein
MKRIRFLVDICHHVINERLCRLDTILCVRNLHSVNKNTLFVYPFNKVFCIFIFLKGFQQVCMQLIQGAHLRYTEKLLVGTTQTIPHSASRLTSSLKYQNVIIYNKIERQKTNAQSHKSKSFAALPSGFDLLPNTYFFPSHPLRG